MTTAGERRADHLRQGYGGPPKLHAKAEARRTMNLAWSWLWGFAEAALFFVVPDVLFTLVMLTSPKRGWQHFGMAIAGPLSRER
jgi:hypothetical protein